MRREASGLGKPSKTESSKRSSEHGPGRKAKRVKYKVLEEDWGLESGVSMKSSVGLESRPLSTMTLWWEQLPQRVSGRLRKPRTNSASLLLFSNPEKVQIAKNEAEKKDQEVTFKTLESPEIPSGGGSPPPSDSQVVREHHDSCLDSEKCPETTVQVTPSVPSSEHNFIKSRSEALYEEDPSEKDLHKDCLCIMKISEGTSVHTSTLCARIQQLLGLSGSEVEVVNPTPHSTTQLKARGGATPHLLATGTEAKVQPGGGGHPIY